MNPRTPTYALGLASLAAAGLLLVSGRAVRQESVPARPGAVFERMADDREYRLTYGWRDFKGARRSIAFPIARRDLAEAEAEFGFSEEELENHLASAEWRKKAEMIAGLKASLQRAIEQSGYGAYIQVLDKGELTFDLKLNAPADKRDEVRPAFEAVKTKMSEEYADGVKRILRELEEEKKAFLEARGISLRGSTLRVLYALSVRKNGPRVRPALDSLRGIDSKLNIRDFLALSLSFIQELAYGLPPEVEGRKNILGFWVAPKVLANNFGDCDSKGAAFAALWNNFKKYPVILIKVPDHMFVGVGIPGFPSETVTINGVRYTLCEVTGVQKIPPGLLSRYSLTYLQSGHYQYELVTD